MKEVIIAGVLFAVAAVVFILSFRSFKGKGFLFNNAYIYASKEERDIMDKKPHYRQTAICFLLIGIIFVLNGIEMLLKTDWLFIAVIAVAVIAIIYAIVSSVKIENKK